ncbi:MAG: transcriptional repressor [Sediminicola sp.]
MKRRNTHSTTVILNSLKESGEALSHERLQSQLGEEMDRATIYRTLNRLHEDGLVHRIVADDGKQYFAFCLDCGEKGHRHDHFHFRCNDCGRVECLSMEIKISLPQGYRGDNFNGLVSGRCAGCA